MNEWNAHNPFGEGDRVFDSELRGMWQDRYRGQPDRIQRLRNSIKEMK